MGHDYISYGDRDIRLLDSDIWELRHFLSREASEVEPADLGVDEPTLRLLREHLRRWEWHGPGVVTGTDLSGFIEKQPQRRDALVRLLRRTIARLDGFGGTIPLAYLQRHLHNGTLIEYVGPRPTGRLVEALKGLVDLVS